MSFLLAQLEPYSRSLRTSVIRCAKLEEGRFEVVLEKTPFFPEGGGQPSDRGTVAGQEVLALYRSDSDEVIHLLQGPVSGEVEASLDWPRRYHFMQQHSAQHMLTALASEQFGWETTAIHLGQDRNDIELAAPSLSIEDLRPLECEANAIIRANRTIRIRIASQEEFRELQARSRRLPADLKGEIRLVEIEGVDLNTCGGTHVASTGEIQVCVLLGTEQLRGGTRVFFLAGNGALRLFGDLVERQKALCRALTCGPEEHLAAVSKLKESTRESDRTHDALLKEFSALVGCELSRQGSPAYLHRSEVDREFLRAIASEFRRCNPEGLVLLTAGSDGEGLFLLAGPDHTVEALGPGIARMLGGRGGGASGFYQGKATRIGNSAAALEAIRAGEGSRPASAGGSPPKEA
jgi:misacylated tRNA(Ala) deacylase